jgi:putative oxidoreductase
MNLLQSFVAAIGRLCLGFVFIVSAISQMLDWQKAEQSIMNGFADWMGYAYQNHWLQKLFELLVPWIPLLLLIAIILEILGGLLLILGVKVRLGSFLLILVLVPSTLLFNYFWMKQGASKDIQLSIFLKNVSIFGGLLLLLAYGKGGKSAASHSSEQGKTP